MRTSLMTSSAPRSKASWQYSARTHSFATVDRSSLVVPESSAEQCWGDRMEPMVPVAIFEKYGKHCPASTH
ncbi:hypothetical protein E2C01_008648 [Portunus trituberculatus]|uniref:Uncharacterized protein n=1 Tax=Portunus trituberculatus TaxID=210409 RepID=A0A5B7D3E6_PORTR|nr:hypothetical protein [Portunus trituberculatus]